MTHSYFQSSPGLKADAQEVHPLEMSSLVINDLDHTPFRSLRPRNQINAGGGVSPQKSQGPVVCSVAPNLPSRPPSSSDNGSLRKNLWNMDYEGESEQSWTRPAQDQPRTSTGPVQDHLSLILQPNLGVEVLRVEVLMVGVLGWRS